MAPSAAYILTWAPTTYLLSGAMPCKLRDHSVPFRRAWGYDYASDGPLVCMRRQKQWASEAGRKRALAKKRLRYHLQNQKRLLMPRMRREPNEAAKFAVATWDPISIDTPV